MRVSRLTNDAERHAEVRNEETETDRARLLSAARATSLATTREAAVERQTRMELARQAATAARTRQIFWQRTRRQ